MKEPRKTRKILYEDAAGNTLVLDTDGLLAGYNNEGEMVAMKHVKHLAQESGLKISFHRGTGKTLAAMPSELLE